MAAAPAVDERLDLLERRLDAFIGAHAGAPRELEEGVERLDGRLGPQEARALVDAWRDEQQRRRALPG